MLACALPRFRADRLGVASIEYGLLAAFVAVVIAVGVAATGTSVNDAMCSVEAGLPDGIATTVGGQTNCGEQAMAACRASGNVWNGTFCETAADAALSVQHLCNTMLGSGYSLWAGNCSFSGGQLTLSSTGSLSANCASASVGGVWNPSGGSLGVGYCVFPKSASATDVVCAFFAGNNKNPDGSCGTTGSGTGIAIVPYGLSKTRCALAGGTLTTNQYGQICQLP